MNAKKIMGAVLVALLAAALFVGAGAADDNFGTVFVYEDTKLTVPANGAELDDGVWNGANGASVTVTDGVVYPGANFVAGTYKYNGDSIYVTYPTATYAIGATIGTPGTAYLVANGGNVYSGSTLTFTIKAANTADAITQVLLTYPNGTVVNTTVDAIDATVLTGKTGTYKIQAIFGIDNFVPGVPSNLLLDTVSALTFKVVGAEDATLTTSADTVYSGETVKLTIKGTPGTKYLLNSSELDIENNQFVLIDEEEDGYSFTMPNAGEATFVAKVVGAKKATIALKYEKDGDFVAVKNKVKVEIKIAAPVVTASLVESSYFIGDDIKVVGTASAKMPFTFTIDGTNIDETDLSLVSGGYEWGKNWKANLSYGDEKLDVGTYTIKVYDSEENVVATLAVALKQPFISIAEAPEVVAQNESATFLINAEAAKGVKAYFFGTNYFKPVDAVAELDENDKEIPNLFNVTLPATETKKDKMATGQYFAVFQHPMYDEKFNIGADETGPVYQNNNGEWNESGKVEIFNAVSRQTANAAQALCDALDSQLIDDMYVKYSFFVVADVKKDTFSMSEIPTEVVKGDKIVITGVDTASKEGTQVSVEMISTAFAAVPKETVGSAAFIVATTEIAEDGTWEITLDTSDLNVDEYSLSVAIAGAEKENVKVNVIEGEAGEQPTEQPTTVPTEQPTTEPTEAPATPGFGALAALAGLGAVAVLLLRRE